MCDRLCTPASSRPYSVRLSSACAAPAKANEPRLATAMAISFFCMMEISPLSSNAADQFAIRRRPISLDRVNLSSREGLGELCRNGAVQGKRNEGFVTGSLSICCFYATNLQYDGSAG